MEAAKPGGHGQAAASPEPVGCVEREAAGVSGQGKRGRQAHPREALRCDCCCFGINTRCCVFVLTGNCCVSGPRWRALTAEVSVTSELR